MTQLNAEFDIRQSVARANQSRVMIISIVSALFIAWGYYLMPDNILVGFNLESLSSWSMWTIFGVFLIGTGCFNLLKLLVFIVKSIGSWGEWHYRLDRESLTWDVPEHSHGPETGFRAKLSEIKEIEFRTVEVVEDFDKKEYWVHFWKRESIQIYSYTSLSLSGLVSKICDAGVAYTETTRAA